MYARKQAALLLASGSPRDPVQINRALAEAERGAHQGEGRHVHMQKGKE